MITDGHGQEFWHTVQTTSRKLRDANVVVFSVSASSDYSLAELTLYAGDINRVFVGDHYNELAIYLWRCFFPL